MSAFLWGAATSSHQIEGYNDKNDWAAWEALGVIDGGVRSSRATDHFNRFREDIRLAAELGLNSYRFSLEWSRLEPEEGCWSRESFEWYGELLAECERHKIVPMITLHHFTSPQWFAARGGFTHASAPHVFHNYVKQVVARWGTQVPLWCTINEPMVLSVGTYLGKFMPPGEYSPERVGISCKLLLKAHALAYQEIRSSSSHRQGIWKNWPLQVGIAHNMLDFLPDRTWHPLEVGLAHLLWRFYNQAWLDAVTGKRQHFWIPGLVPNPGELSEMRGRRTVDFIGVNYYTKAYVQWNPKAPAPERPANLPLGIAFARRNDLVSDLDWALHPQGFRKVLRFASRYGLPLYVTENGIADRDDRLRPQYLTTHLRELAHAIEKGADIRGYYHWSLLDNFEWIKGFGPRFGLYHVNYETFERTPTASAKIYRDLIKRHQERGVDKPKANLL